jgi:hypothetical protein
MRFPAFFRAFFFSSSNNSNNTSLQRHTEGHLSLSLSSTAIRKITAEKWKFCGADKTCIRPFQIFLHKMWGRAGFGVSSWDIF